MRACLLLAIAIAGCGQDPCFHDLLDDHRAELVACQPGDTCVVPQEDEACACFGAYNQKQQQLWDDLRSESKCEDCPHGFCPHQINPRCEDGECRTDNAAGADQLVPGRAAPPPVASPPVEGGGGRREVMRSLEGLRRARPSWKGRIRPPAPCGRRDDREKMFRDRVVCC